MFKYFLYKNTIVDQMTNSSSYYDMHDVCMKLNLECLFIIHIIGPKGKKSWS